MTTIPLQDAQAQLAESIHQLTPGDLLTITETRPPWHGLSAFRSCRSGHRDHGRLLRGFPRPVDGRESSLSRRTSRNRLRNSASTGNETAARLIPCSGFWRMIRD